MNEGMTETTDITNRGARGSPKNGQPPQPPILDIEEHRADLAQFNYTKEQEDELIKSLWGLVCTAIDTGFGLDAVSMIIPAFTEKALECESQELDSKGTHEIEQEFNTLTHTTNNEGEM
ncbi:hypothetical protein MNBD_GAMMA03-677 [hydrothermal vent metagenome]|uniref:Uncharacterized protein n=1 Tax=hydrothermal vent metagenome TaxID=652676 RepID=A0A3B0W1G7_9ZZZZ